MDRLDSDGISHEVRVVPARPSLLVPAPFTPMNLASELRDAIAAALSEVKAYELRAECVRFGLSDGEDTEAWKSKFRYVHTRLGDYNAAELTQLGQRVLERHHWPELWGLLEVLQTQQGGVAGFKNLIFAANGPKPHLVLRDAVSNIIEVTKNAEFCLIYDRPLSGAGLSWADLVAWWGEVADLPVERDAANALFTRLARSLDTSRPAGSDPGPETITFRIYAELIKEHGYQLPALIPQVYLHYDPQNQAGRRTPGRLPRQRMDFLMLLRGGRRLVIEIDGKHHYADGDRASPARYAEMVARRP